MLKALLKFFGGSSDKDAGRNVSGNGPKSAKELSGFVSYVAEMLVDYPDEVKVTASEKDDECVIQISCRKEDIGKVVGKKGKTIMAIRSLVSGAAGRLQKRISVEVLD